MSHSPENHQPDAPADVNVLMTIDFSKPEGSKDRYMATVVPNYEASEATTGETKELIFGKSLGKFAVGYLTPSEALPILQEIERPSGFAATPEEAARIALNNWIRFQQMYASESIDISH